MAKAVEPELINMILTEDTSSWPTDAVLFFCISMALGMVCRHLLHGTIIPYTVALLIIGIALGSLEYGTDYQLGKIGDSIRIWANIDPDLLLAVFLPALLFESAFSMEMHQIKRCIAQMLLLAGPGVLISTFCLGSALKLTFPYNWSWNTSLLLGGLLSATDPVAVIASLKELGTSKKLSTLIEGESLMNDGIAIVIYQLFYRMVLGENSNAGEIVSFLAQNAFGAVGIGLAFGIASVVWLGFIFNDTVLEIMMTVLAQEGLQVSGILAVMTLGMFYASAGRTAFKGDGLKSLHLFWEMVAYVANTLIFILSGVIIAQSALATDVIFQNQGHSWGYLFLLYIFVQLSRFIAVGVMYPFLRYLGYGLDWKEAAIIIWSGLRGAVALSLALSVKFVFFTGGIVFLTLIVNGSTTQFILHAFDMDKLSAVKKRILNYTKYEMVNKALAAFGDLGDDEELGPADWPIVKRYITGLTNLEGGRLHHQSATEAESNLDRTNLKDIRVRLLNGVQSAYWEMLEEGSIKQSTASILMQSVDEAIDLTSHGSLCDWKGLKAHVQFPSYYRFLHSSICPRKLVSYFIVGRLESACSICAAFLRAHRIARRQLHEFIVINESEAEAEEAREFLEEVRISFPEVLRAVKTRQVTYSVLNHLSDYVQNLEKIGLLEQKETLHLHDVVQTDLKRLQRSPPLVKLPKINDLISVHPLLGALPSTLREHLEGSNKGTLKSCGVPLYKEGSRPKGIWLISNGVVKWKSNSLRNKHSQHPTFSHGSILGIYEVLVGKPYICDITTESLVFCFFIESEKILSALQSDPAIEGFLWKESVIMLAKILLPQIFEKMSMLDLRTLVAERSMMTMHMRGETIEVPDHSVGFLLEGSVNAHGFQEEFIASPSALLPPHGNHSFGNAHANQSIQNEQRTGSGTDSFTNQRFWYQVDTRARVIMFDIAAFEVDSARQSSLSSLQFTSDHSCWALSRERDLMSCPENL